LLAAEVLELARLDAAASELQSPDRPVRRAQEAGRATVATAACAERPPMTSQLEFFREDDWTKASRCKRYRIKRYLNHDNHPAVGYG